MVLDDLDAVNFLLNLVDELHCDVQIPETRVAFRSNAVQRSADGLLAHLPELLDQNFAILQLHEACRAEIDEEHFDVAG